MRCVSKSVRVVKLPGLAHGQDVSDWLNITTNTKEELQRIALRRRRGGRRRDIARPVVQSSAELPETISRPTI